MTKGKCPIRLVISGWMDDRYDAEKDRIRVPKRARVQFNLTGDRIKLKVNDKVGILEIKQARKSDIDQLTLDLRNGKVTREQASITGFVTTETLSKFVGRRRNRLEEFCYITEGVDDLMLGADPEFVLVDPSTSRFSYAARVPGFPGKTAEMGSDGPCAEIRPKPSTDVGDVINNMYQAMKNGQSNIDQFDWIAGATYQSPKYAEDRIVQMGGHIHVGNPALLKEEHKNAAYGRIIQILDETVAIPLARIDTPSPDLRRNKKYNGYGNFGRWGDQRPQPGRFEWRVPSALWLAHPDLAQAVLGTTKAVSEECYQRIAEHDFDPKWVAAAAGSKGLLKDWGVLDVAKAKAIINEANAAKVTPELITRAANKLRGMSNYGKYKAEIKEFLRIVRLSTTDRKRLSLDMKRNWLEKKSLIKKG